MSEESNTGAFNGQCNFMSVGQSDGYVGTYVATNGNATVLKLNAAGEYAPISDYATRCKDRFGVTVSASGSARLGQKVRFANGTGSADPVSGEVSIQWTGTFSVNYYGTLTPFWIIDPELVVGADGTGSVTATLGGWASDMNNPDVQVPATPRPGVVIATLSGVDSKNSAGFVSTPVFSGRHVRVGGGSAGPLRSGLGIVAIVVRRLPRRDGPGGVLVHVRWSRGLPQGTGPDRRRVRRRDCTDHDHHQYHDHNNHHDRRSAGATSRPTSDPDDDGVPTERAGRRPRAVECDARAVRAGVRGCARSFEWSGSSGSRSSTSGSSGGASTTSTTSTTVPVTGSASQTGAVGSPWLGPVRVGR